MESLTLLTLIVCAVFGTVCVVLLVLILKKSPQSLSDERLASLRRELVAEQREARREAQSNIAVMSDMLSKSQDGAFTRQDARMDALTRGVSQSLSVIDERFKSFSLQSEQKLDNIRVSMERSLSALQLDNNRQLERMRATVDEKLQQTLEEKLTKSFGLVSERLEQVYKGLGEMQTLAVGVGDLKKVLSNVKTRGILGEIQLGAIIEQMMSPEQYDTEVPTRHDSRERVEYAVKIPSDEGGHIYLPIDAKFPLDTYSALVDAYDAADPAAVETAAKQLVARIRQEAKDIRDKYVDPPFTTDFAILFLPIEGLYAEVVRRGLVESLQRDFKISIAGPTTMAALLNSLQMGFRTLAIQKRSGEVWRVLGQVKTEFDSFAGVLALTQQRLAQANSELDKLVGVRTRQIQRRLKDVSAFDEAAKRENIEEKQL